MASTSTGKTASNQILDNSSDKPFQKSRRRTPLREFIVLHHIRPEVAAGFRVWLQGDDYHFDDEWDTLLQSYLSR